MERKGLGTVVRPAGTNGEVPRPLRTFCVFVEISFPQGFQGSCRQVVDKSVKSGWRGVIARVLRGGGVLISLFIECGERILEKWRKGCHNGGVFDRLSTDFE